MDPFVTGMSTVGGLMGGVLGCAAASKIGRTAYILGYSENSAICMQMGGTVVGSVVGASLGTTAAAMIFDECRK